jgi:hypothetical protein
MPRRGVTPRSMRIMLGLGNLNPIFEVTPWGMGC